MIQVYQTQALTVCDVCRLLDKDLMPKPCAYCNMCSSWICQQDGGNWLRRARAFLVRKLEPDFKGDPAYKTGDIVIDKALGL